MKKKKKCELCSEKVNILYLVHIDKDSQEFWCEECINEEENNQKRLFKETKKD